MLITAASTAEPQSLHSFIANRPLGLRPKLRETYKADPLDLRADRRPFHRCDGALISLRSSACAVSVESKPGGIGMVADETVARATPDGTTLLVSLQSVLAQAPASLKRPPINVDKELVPQLQQSAEGRWLR